MIQEQKDKLEISESNQQELVEEVINYENLPIFKCIEGYENKQTSIILDYTKPLKVLDMKKSEAEGVGEVLYFLEDPLVPHLKKYFEEVVNEEVVNDILIQNEEIINEEIIPTSKLDTDSSNIQN